MKKICKNLEVKTALDEINHLDTLYVDGVGWFNGIEPSETEVLLTKNIELSDFAHRDEWLMTYKIGQWLRKGFVLKNLQGEILLLASQPYVDYILQVYNQDLLASSRCARCELLATCETARELVTGDAEGGLSGIRAKIKILGEYERIETARVRNLLESGIEVDGYLLVTKISRGKEVVSVICDEDTK